MTHVLRYIKQERKTLLSGRVMISMESRMSLRCLWTSSGGVHWALRYYCLVRRKGCAGPCIWSNSVRTNAQGHEWVSPGKMHRVRGEGQGQDTEEQNLRSSQKTEKV